MAQIVRSMEMKIEEVSPAELAALHETLNGISNCPHEEMQNKSFEAKSTAASGQLKIELLSSVYDHISKTYAITLSIPISCTARERNSTRDRDAGIFRFSSNGMKQILAALDILQPQARLSGS